MVEDLDIESLVNELRSLKVRVSQVETQLCERRAQEEAAATLLTPPTDCVHQPGERRSSADHQQNQTTSKLACTLG